MEPGPAATTSRGGGIGAQTITVDGSATACFRKNGALAAAHWSRSERSHATLHGRAPGPLSQPEIIQWSD